MRNKCIIAILIVALCLGALVGCAPAQPEQPIYYDAEYAQPEQVQTVVLCDGGESEYKVLIPADFDEIEKYASEELCLFIEKATGCELKVVTDEGLTYNENDKYISIGETSLKTESDITVDFSEYGRDGFVIKYVDNSYVICGGGSYGSLYGVYEFLHQAIGWETYSADEIYYNNVTKLETAKYNLSDVPAFASRTGGYFEGRNDPYSCARLRTFSANFDGVFGNDDWCLSGWVHNLYRVMPAEKYNNPKNAEPDHPEWYQGGQLCLSNAELRDEFASRFIGIINDNPSVTNFLISNMDNLTYCQCDNCMWYNRRYDRYEGEFDVNLECSKRDNLGRSVLQMEFTNYVAEKVWNALASDPKRQSEVKVVYCAYYHSEQAPVEEVNGEWVAIKDEYVDCTPFRNVAVMYACINSGFYYELTDEKHNADTKRILDGWKALGVGMYGYVYGNNFNRTAEWFDDFSSVQKNMQYFANEGGGHWFFTENASSSKQAVSFQILRQYVYSKLQWNPNLDINELIDDFMLNYYKAGAEKMREYYDYIRLYYDTKFHKKEVDGEITGVLGHIGFEYGAGYHDFNSLLQMNDILSNAVTIVKNAGYDSFNETKLVNRIKAESLTVRYYLLNYCQKSIDDVTYVNLVEDFRKDANELEIFNDANKLCDAWLGAIEG